MEIVRRYSWPFQYQGNLVWPILFTFLFPPLAIFLCLKNMTYIRGNTTRTLTYNGSWFWVFFWVILFFPVAIALLCVRGVDVIERVEQ